MQEKEFVKPLIDFMVWRMNSHGPMQHYCLYRALYIQLECARY